MPGIFDRHLRPSFRKWTDRRENTLRLPSRISLRRLVLRVLDWKSLTSTHYLRHLFCLFPFRHRGGTGVEPALQNLKKNYWSQNQKASDNEILLEEIQITENVPVKLAKWNKGHRSKPSRMMNPPLPQVTKTELLLTVWIQYQAGRWREWRRTSIMGLVVEPIPNSLNSHHKSCLADSKDNY